MQNSARREGGFREVTGRTIRVLGSVTREGGLGRTQGRAIRVSASVTQRVSVFAKPEQPALKNQREKTKNIKGAFSFVFWFFWAPKNRKTKKPNNEHWW